MRDITIVPRSLNKVTERLTVPASSAIWLTSIWLAIYSSELEVSYININLINLVTLKIEHYHTFFKKKEKLYDVK